MKHVSQGGIGSEDNLPPSDQDRRFRGCIRGTGRTSGAASYPSEQNNMETLVHQFEQEAYHAVVLAFKAQSDSITWEKTNLMTALREELRVSSQHDREVQNRAKDADIIHIIREWRQAGGGIRSGVPDNAQPLHHSGPSPTISTTHQRPKTSKSMPSLSLCALPAALPLQTRAIAMQPSFSATKRSTGVEPKNKKPKGQVEHGVMVMKSVQYPSSGPSDKSRVGPAVGVSMPDPYQLRGRTVMKRWPEDDEIHGALTDNYDPASVWHAPDYHFEPHTREEEWVDFNDFNEARPEDVQWEDEDPGISQVGRSRSDHQKEKPMEHLATIPGRGRGRGSPKAQPDFPPSHNDIVKKNSDEIEIFHTHSLLEEVARVVNASHPDPLEVEIAKKLIEKEERSLINAIARLDNPPDGGNDDSEQ